MNTSNTPETFLFDPDSWYDNQMNKDQRLTPEEVKAARKRRLEGMHLQHIEGNPLDAEDVALFEMFDRERWSHERRIEHIRGIGRELAGHVAAE
jgi:hypothetical protein